MRAGRHRLTLPPLDLLRVLDEAAARDTVAEGGTRKYGCLAAASAVGALVLLAVLLPNANNEPGLLGLLVRAQPWVHVPLVLAALVCLWLSFQHSRHDLDDQKLAVLRDVLEPLRRDLPEHRPLDLEVDFRDAGQRGFRIPGGHEYPFLSLSSTHTRLRFYVQPWLRLEVRLPDASRLRVEVRRHLRRKEKRKVKRRRTRTRVFDRIREVVDVRLRPAAPVEPEAFLARVQEVAPRKLNLVWVRADGGVLRARFTTDEAGGHSPLTAEKVLAALAWVHRPLSL